MQLQPADLPRKCALTTSRPQANALPGTRSFLGCRRLMSAFAWEVSIPKLHSRGVSEGVPSAPEPGTLGLVLGQAYRFVVRRDGLVASAEPAQQVGPGRPPRLVAGQVEPVDLGQRDLGTVEFGDHDGAVEPDDG